MQNKNISNLGCVIYTKSKTGIEAEWLFTSNGKLEKGTGIGKRISKSNFENEFEGDYEIIYIDSEGKSSPKIDLKITKQINYFELIWSFQGEISEVGIGIEKDEKLIVSWKRV